MSAVKLTFGERTIANSAAIPFRPFNVGRVIRGVLWSVASGAVLYAAAREVDGYLSAALWVLFGLRIFPYFFTGMLQKVADERQARLAFLSSTQRRILTTDKALARHFEVQS